MLPSEKTKSLSECKISHFQVHGLFLKTVQTDAIFFKMQNFAFRNRFGFSRETFQCTKINFCQKSINFGFFLVTSPRYIVQKSGFLCKILMIIHNKSLISIKNLCLDQKIYIVINHFDWSNCVFVCTVTYPVLQLPFKTTILCIHTR